MQLYKKLSSVMESETIQKNEASPKSLMSRGNVKLMTLFILLASAFAFSSCDKNDDENENSSKLIGKWILVKVVSDDGHDREDYTDDSNFYIFAKNGTGQISGEGNYLYDITWKYAHPVLTLNYDGETEICTIEKLTDSELVYLTDWGMRFYFEKDVPLPDNNAGKKLLTGTWVITSDVGYEKTSSGKTRSYKYVFDISNNSEKYVFKSNDTFDLYGDEGDLAISGTWSYANEKILLNGNGGYNEEYTVIKLTSSKLVYKYVIEYGTNVGFYGEKTFEKIK